MLPQYGPDYDEPDEQPDQQLGSASDHVRDDVSPMAVDSTKESHPLQHACLFLRMLHWAQIRQNKTLFIGHTCR